MARLFVAANPDHLEMSALVVSAYPFTVMGWAYTSSLSAPQTLWAMARTSVNNALLRLVVETDGTASIQAQSGGTINVVSTTASISLNAWFHVAGIWTSATDRKVYLNGGNLGSSTVSRAFPGSMNVTTLGRTNNTGSNIPFGGRLDYVGVWDVALDADEVLAGAQGADPRSIRSLGLEDLRILGLNSPEGNWVGAGNTMTVTGTTVAQGPPVAVWRRRLFTAAPWVAAAGPLTQSLSGSVGLSASGPRQTAKRLVGGV